MEEFEQVEVLIASNGAVRLKVHGVKGPACERLTEPLRELLGNDLADHERTPEYFERAEQVDEQVSEQSIRQRTR